jgi:hypothetical protein
MGNNYIELFVDRQMWANMRRPMPHSLII